MAPAPLALAGNRPERIKGTLRTLYTANVFNPLTGVFQTVTRPTAARIYTCVVTGVVLWMGEESFYVLGWYGSPSVAKRMAAGWRNKPGYRACCSPIATRRRPHGGPRKPRAGLRFKAASKSI
jgi:hypothetical protein